MILHVKLILNDMCDSVISSYIICDMICNTTRLSLDVKDDVNVNMYMTGLTSKITDKVTFS